MGGFQPGKTVVRIIPLTLGWCEKMKKTNSVQSGKNGDGIRLGRFHAATAAVIVLLSVLLLLSTYLTSRGYSRMQEATERYITAQRAAANMQAASDYLTAEARAFVVTGDLTRVENFFEETVNTRRRDKALDEIDEFIDSPSTYDYLRTALDNSNELLKIECYAMRLAAESYGCELSELPAALRELTPEQADLRLEPDQQREKALIMLFDETYQSYKNQISKNVSLSVEVLIRETREQQMESSSQLLRLLRREEVLIVLLLMLSLIMVLSTVYLVSRPLRSYISHIQRDEKLPAKGASELRFLAHTYNQVREQNLRHRAQLSYDATHDALTGVFNRSVFEKLRARCNDSDHTLLIVDLDKFKSINDENGHDVGDRALCYVAALLQENFRAEDYICRIGGDEFAVIMVHTNSALRDLVAGKIRRINEILQTPKDGLPPISLSVGVAFGDRKNPTDDFFKDADTALYRTKSVRTGGCEFY